MLLTMEMIDQDTTNQMESLGSRLRDKMKEKGISPDELGERIGADGVYIRDIWYGRSKNPKKLPQIAAELGTTPSNLKFGTLDMDIAHVQAWTKFLVLEIKNIEKTAGIKLGTSWHVEFLELGLAEGLKGPVPRTDEDKTKFINLITSMIE